MSVLSMILGVTLVICLVEPVVAEPSCVCLKTIAEFERGPSVLYQPDDGTGRLLIATLEGFIFVYYKNGSHESQPFLDIRGNVTSGNEKGLVGLATHPNFKANRRFYIYYTRQNVSGTYLRLSEMKVRKDNPNQADISSEMTLIELKKQTQIHHAGQLLFDKDGYLLVFIGDNGPQKDPQNHGQDRNTLMGSALRLDVSKAATKTEPYRIPPDNPFVNDSNSRPEIWAYGFRNPWNAKMDPGPGENTGRIFVSDVGWRSYEEVSILVKGRNYGWNLREGNVCLEGKNCNNIPNEMLPIRAYDRSEGNCVIGGVVYRGCLNPSLNGCYIYADYGFGVLWTLKEDSDGSWINTNLNRCPTCPAGLTNRNLNRILNFGQCLEGEAYILSADKGAAGAVQLIVDLDRYEDRKAECESKIGDIKEGILKLFLTKHFSDMVCTDVVCLMLLSVLLCFIR